MTTIEYIEKAWIAYKKNFWAIIIAIILQFLLISIPFIIGLLPWIIIFFTSGISLTQTSIANFILSYLGVFSFSFVMFVIGLFASIILNGGFVRMLYEGLRRKTRFEIMLKTAKEKFWTILGANLLVLLIFLIIIAALFAPIGILLGSSLSLQGASFLYIFIILSTVVLGVMVLVLVSIFFVFVNQAVVIDNLSAVQAVKRSFKVSEKNFLSILFLFLIFFIFNNGLYNFLFILGTILVWFLTAPLLLLSYTAFYVEKRKKFK